MHSDTKQAPASPPSVPFFASKAAGRVVGAPVQMSGKERVRKLSDEPAPARR